MPEISVLISQLSPKLGDVAANVESHIAVIQEARKNGHQLVVFPELSLTGYLLKDLVSDVCRSEQELLDLFSDIGKGSEIEFVVGWLERSEGYQYYNALAHIHLDRNGKTKLLHNHRKVNLPTYGMFEEERYFSQGKSLRAYNSPLLGRCGMLICEDLWHPANPLLLSLDGANLEGVRTIIVGSNSPARGLTDNSQLPHNAAIWQLLARYAALTCNALVLVAQRSGVEDGFVYTGGSEIIGPGGEAIAQAPLFERATLTANVALDSLIRERRTMLPGGSMDDYDRIVRELTRIGKCHLDGDSK